MKLFAETVLYGMQIAAVFVLAGPVLVRVERQRTLSRNPTWVSTHLDFLNENQKASMVPLMVGGILMALCLAINGYGALDGAMLPKRALGNVVFLGAVSSVVLYGFYYTLRRQSYRISQATDDLARKFEFQMILVVAYFITGIVLYYSVGCLGKSIMRPPSFS